MSKQNCRWLLQKLEVLTATYDAHVTALLEMAENAFEHPELYDQYMKQAAHFNDRVTDLKRVTNMPEDNTFRVERARLQHLTACTSAKLSSNQRLSTDPDDYTRLK
jgi:hypothetical protein